MPNVYTRNTCIRKVRYLVFFFLSKFFCCGAFIRGGKKRSRRLFRSFSDELFLAAVRFFPAGSFSGGGFFLSPRLLPFFRRRGFSLARFHAEASSSSASFPGPRVSKASHALPHKGEQIQYAIKNALGNAPRLMLLHYSHKPDVSPALGRAENRHFRDFSACFCCVFVFLFFRFVLYKK